MSNLGWPLNDNKIRTAGLANAFGGTYGWVRNNSTSPYSAHTGPDGHLRNWPHQGWDLIATPGTPVYASADGVVVFKGGSAADTTDYGLRIIVQYGSQYLFYAHLSNVLVADGEPVTYGQHIADTGNSGNAHSLTGLAQHLHFEVRTSSLLPPQTTNPPNPFLGRLDPAVIFGPSPFTIVQRVIPVPQEATAA